MNLVLPPQILKLIEDRVRSGRYQTPEDVVAAAVAQLDLQEREGEAAAAEFDEMLADGGPVSSRPPLEA